MANKNTPDIPSHLLDQPLAGSDPCTAVGSNGPIGDLKRARAEGLLNGHIQVHLTNEAEVGIADPRNGSSQKTVLMSEGEVAQSIPLDRHAPLDPVLVPAVADSIIDDVDAWQAQPLDSCYAIVFFDALRVKVLEHGVVHDKTAYLAIGVRASGHKQVLGVWIEQSERAQFWLHVLNDIKARGTQDILIAVVEDPRHFAEAIAAVFPETMLQTSIANLIRYSIRTVPWKERRLVARALQPIYCANSIEGAAVALELFDQDDWGAKYPEVTQRWRRNWDALISFFALPADVRRTIYTTSAIELLKGTVRQAVRNKRGFPDDQAAIEVIWLALRGVSEKWKNPPAPWRAAKEELAIQFKDRFE